MADLVGLDDCNNIVLADAVPDATEELLHRAEDALGQLAVVGIATVSIAVVSIAIVSIAVVSIAMVAW